MAERDRHDDQPDRRSDPPPRGIAEGLPDAREREVGRQGVAEARRILARIGRGPSNPR